MQTLTPQLFDAGSCQTDRVPGDRGAALLDGLRALGQADLAFVAALIADQTDPLAITMDNSREFERLEGLAWEDGVEGDSPSSRTNLGTSAHSG